MSNYTNEPEFTNNITEHKEKVQGENYLLHIVLFIATFITTSIAGTHWILGYGSGFEFSQIAVGLPYSISMLFILSVHEFGHYFASRFHRVKASLPYFIPFPALDGFLNFGTLGAVIKTKTAVGNKKALFDIGIAGPIAGFIASLVVLVWGFTHLPGVDYILAIHPDYFDPNYGSSGLKLEFGDTLLFYFLREIFTTGKDFVPPMSEIYHYPYLSVGWFGLFVTAMNMIPVGQLDGGHISYSMFGGKNHLMIASICMIMLTVLGVSGFVTSFLEINFILGWSGWLFWALVLYFFIKIKHPPVQDETPIGKKRKILGYISFIIFILSFSPAPFTIGFGT